jgi:mannose-6-phosphate isomerase-like protein (cupin superfamily)
MYLASKHNGARLSFAEDIGAGDVTARWLISDELGGAALGKVGLIEIGLDGAAHLTSDARREHMVFVLGGRGVAHGKPLAVDVREGSVIFLPNGKTIELRPRDDVLRLLLIQGVRGAAGAETGITHLEQVENVSFHRPELGFLHVAARWLVGSNAAKSGSLVVGQSTFVPGAAHLLHKHDHADEFFYVFEGRGAHLVEGGEVAMNTGDAVFAPRGEWHGFRNKSDIPVRAIFGYFGVTSLEKAGYEVHEHGKVEG